MIREAEFSIDKKERYSLKREWDKSKNKILYIMLNPSFADDKDCLLYTSPSPRD